MITILLYKLPGCDACDVMDNLIYNHFKNMIDNDTILFERKDLPYPVDGAKYPITVLTYNYDRITTYTGIFDVKLLEFDILTLIG